MTEPTLVEQLRTCAASKPDYQNPHWVDAAKRLMNWAADAIEAANKALSEKEEGK